ncbi:hypothetical protein [Spiroplasma floricola]|uniref:Uncharacterized protein n=1 Tax=Spiroplasma floricola 23-6 TaxID=1336749 RepID=A0A2K8SE51_9MOLU|nr:hypothetical protein [Spiroplasma floricola]AUB31702.1 hypothetical protein SFLOR_v1c06520 [Spiroplasma floricola 23-6]
MNNVNFLKKLNTILIERECNHIEFFDSKDVQLNDEGQSYELKNVYKVHFLNTKDKIVNLYIKFDENDWLIKASNQNNISYYCDLTGKENYEKDELINLYLDKSSKIGLLQLKTSLQHWPIVFLEQVIDESNHIFVNILKYKNLENQSITDYDCLFIDNEEEFFNAFLENWI